MLLIDDRVGSKDLIDHLPRSLCSLSRLEYGDVALAGSGPGGPILAAVEIKTISDALNSITTGRFAGHQLPGLLNIYDYTWLVIEGQSRTDRDSGILQVPWRGTWKDMELGGRYFLGKDFDCWLLTMEVKCGVRLRRTYDRRETANFLVALHSWWTSKDWEAHRSHMVSDESGQPALVEKPSLVRRVAKELPGVGWTRAGAVEQTFKTVLDLVLADEKEWVEIEGIGKVISHQVVAALRGQEARKHGGEKHLAMKV